MARTDEPVYTLEDGKFLITIARKSILNFLTFNKILPQPEDIPAKFLEESGVFVTLNKPDEKGNKKLRGCIGFPTPVYPLVQATIEAAKSSAVSDPRFPTVEIEEMKEIVIEVTILTPPILMQVKDPKEYLKKIKIGHDGLIVKSGGRSGLLLPQVPKDWNWTVEEFLEHTCGKAWLPENCWKDMNTEIYSFSGIIYKEVEPNGEVVLKEI
ncbi:MAG: TIGR00296 family protein [Candidatus Heimdallarchaeota archaeon]|nr:MAG: TIGR00296 family protein [Candidatus Heimdallarchaeota archaeon]